MKRKLTILAVSIAAAFAAVPAASASAYLHVSNAGDACADAARPTATANLASYGYGNGGGTYIYTRYTDTHVKIFQEWNATASFGPTMYFDSTGQAWYLYDETSCDVYGSDPAPSVASIGDYGVAWRHTIGAP